MITKRHVSLLEMLIALSLVTILLSALMAFYSFTSSTQLTVDKIRKDNFRSLYLQHRLGQILPRSFDKPAKQDKTPFWFYTPLGTSTPELIFVYDNGVDGIPPFSNAVLGRLFLEEGKLILLSWSTQMEWRKADAPAREEILDEGVVQIAFSFFNPPKPSDADKPIDDLKDPPGWFAQWPIEKDKLPAMMKITVWKEGQKTPKIYGFVMGKTTSTILYKS